MYLSYRIHNISFFYMILLIDYFVFFDLLVIMPLSALDKLGKPNFIANYLFTKAIAYFYQLTIIYGYITAMLDINYPMSFEVSRYSSQRVSHCGVLEFVAEEGIIYMPQWVL